MWVGTLWAGVAWAAEVRGTLVDDVTGAPVTDAQVVGQVGTTRSTTTTDDAGRFVLDLPEGRGTVDALSIEHRPVTVDVTIAEGMEALDLRLKPGSFEEVTVLYYDDPDPVVTKRTVTAEDVARVPGAFGDPVRVVTSLPGAARPPFGSSQLIIRGGNEDDTTVFLDGVEIPVVYHVGGYRSVIHPSLVAQVSFLPGVFPSRYGDTTSGVVDIQTRADWNPGWEATAQVDLLDASAAVRGTVADKVGIAASIRRSYIDAVLAPFSDDFVLPRWFDYQVQVQSLDLGAHTLRLMAFGLQDNVGRDDSSFGITTSTTSHRAVATWVFEPSGALKTLVQPSIGWDDESAGIGTAIEVQETGLRTGLRSEVRWTPIDALVVVGGAQVQASNLTIDAKLPFDPRATADGLAAFEATDTRWVVQPDPYLAIQARPLHDRQRLVLSAGVRMESMLRQDLEPETGVSPRGSLRWKVTGGGTFKAGASLTHQMPSSTALAFSPDTALSLERATSAEIGWEQTAQGLGSLDVVVYGRTMDRIATQPTVGPPSFDNIGQGRAYGLEVLLSKAPGGRFFGWVSYALSRSERIDDPETSGTWLLYDYDQTHNLVAVGGLQLGKGWDLGGRFQHTTGNPYTPYEGAVFELSDATYTGVPSGEVNSARLPAYTALDVRVSKQWNLGRTGHIKAYVDMLNLVQGENPEFVVDAYDYSENAFVTGLPFLPAVGVSAELRF